MQIRRATTADRAELIKLLAEFHEHTQTTLSTEQAKFRTLKPGSESEAHTANATDYLTNPDYIVFVAETADTLQGYICGQINNHQHRIYHREGYIKDWFVSGQSRHQRIGKQLWNALAQELEAADCTHLTVATHLENRHAIEIYKHLGFTERAVSFFKFLR